MNRRIAASDFTKCNRYRDVGSNATYYGERDPLKYSINRGKIA
jgi:hypothetical protein